MKFLETVTAKILFIGILIFVLLIPVNMILSLVNEREGRSLDVKNEISEKWGRAQVVAGPILTVPYEVVVERDEKEFTEKRYAHFLPDSLHINSDIDPEIRQRGIFEAVLYKSKLRMAGTFVPPDMSSYSPKTVLTEDAFLTLGVADIRGINSPISIMFGGAKKEMLPGTNVTFLQTGAHASFPLPEQESIPFSAEFELNGHESISFLPVGKQMTAAMKSSWPTPSFEGSFLPESHTINDDGFSASWEISNFSRPYPSQWSNTKNIRMPLSSPSSDPFPFHAKTLREEPFPSGGNTLSFGTKFLQPVDFYQKNTRAVKYAVLFVVFTFLIFFLYEVLIPELRVHPMQYLFTGFALCLFYILLLAFSEHIGFGLAYLTASIATVIMIAGYSASVLCGKLRASIIGLLLAFLYAFLYILLQVEDYALLFGAIACFLVLGAAMFVTRKVDWYSVQMSSKKPKKKE